jgi:hypothetical protein
LLRWEDHIKIDITEKGWDVMEWIHLALDRDELWAVVNTVMNLRVSLYARNISH